MAAYAGTLVGVGSLPNLGIVEKYFYTQDEADAGDTIAITLADHGISDTGLLAVSSWVQTANGSIITVEANTVAVSAGVLTVTIVAGTDNDVRVIKVIGLSKAPDYTA